MITQRNLTNNVFFVLGSSNKNIIHRPGASITTVKSSLNCFLLHQSFYKRHRSLCKALTVLDEMYSPYILGFLAISIPLVILACYSMLLVKQISIMMAYAFMIGTQILFLCLVMWYPAKLTEAVSFLGILSNGLCGVCC